MARRPSQLRLTSRTTLSADTAPQNRQVDAPQTTAPHAQALSWEDLLGRR